MKLSKAARPRRNRLSQKQVHIRVVHIPPMLGRGVPCGEPIRRTYKAWPWSPGLFDRDYHSAMTHMICLRCQFIVQKCQKWERDNG